MTRPNPQREQEAVIEWNHLNRVGCDVIMTRDDGSEKQTKTASEAWLMGGHSACVMLECVSGGYSLHRVTAVTSA